MGSLKETSTVELLYNKRVTPGNIEFPVQLQEFQKNLPFGHPYSYRDWLLKHSSLLYYSPFITKKTFDNLNKQLDNETLNTSKLKHYLGLAGNTVSSPEYFRFCQQCLNESIEEIGEGYWNILHQLPSVRLCHIHHVPLSITDIDVNTKTRNNLFIPLSDNIAVTKIEKIPINERSFYVYLTEETAFLFNQPLQEICIEHFHKWYKTKFLEKTWLSLKYRFNRDVFIHDMYMKLPNSFIEEFNINPNDIDWIANLLSEKSRVFIHPIRMMALNYILGVTFKEVFYEKSKNYNPFGKGPWVCQNPVCLFYHKPSIKNITIRTNKKDRLPLGIFECSHCEFIYMRKGPEKDKMEQFSRLRVLNYGELFKKELLYLVPYHAFNYSAVTRILGIDQKTLKTWYERWSSEVHSENKMKEKINEMRIFWKKKLSKYPNESRSFFQETFLKEYRWISNFDFEWFENNFPKTQDLSFSKRRKRKPDTYKKKDWGTLDPEYAVQIQDVVESLYKQTPPIRITKAKIESQIEYIGFFKKYERELPLSNDLLNNSLED